MILNIFATIVTALSFNSLVAQKGIEVNCTSQDNNITYTISNIKSNLESDFSKIKDLVENYNLDLDSLNKAESVSLSIDELDYSSCGYAKYGSDTYSDDEGYITMTTIVYDYGKCPSGEKIYNTQVNLKYNKCFYLRHKDSLIIRTGEGAVQDFDYSSNANFTYNRIFDGSTKYYQNVSTDLSSTYGIKYEVKLPSDTAIVGAIEANKAINWEMSASYYFIAKSTTYVQACYVHNESLLGDKFSISIKKVSLAINGDNTTYYGKGVNIYVK